MSVQNKKKIKESRSRIEVESNNVLDADVRAALRPLRLMQACLLSPKYHVRNNAIVPGGLLAHLISVTGTVCVIALFLYRLIKFHFDESVKKYINSLYVTSYYDFVFYSIGFSLNCYISIFKSRQNIQFVLLYQDVHRYLNDEKYLKNIIGNWSWVVFVFSLYAFIAAVILLCCLHLPFYTLFSSVLLICFDGNIIYAIRCIHLLKNKVHLWNEKMLLNSRVSRNLRRKDHYKDMFDAYINLLNCYNIYKTISEHVILYYITEFFSHALIHVQILIEMLKLSKKHIQINISITTVSVYSWLIKTFVLQTVLCVYSEQLYAAMRRSQDCCVIILSTNHETEARRVCKNVRRAHRALFSAQCACGLVRVDAALPPALLALVAHYVIVLLQFAFL